MNNFKKYMIALSGFCWLLLGLPALAQTAASEIPMADQFRADGKIYVVIAVLSVILLGIVVFLFMLDRKLSRLERQLKG